MEYPPRAYLRGIYDPATMRRLMEMYPGLELPLSPSPFNPYEEDIQPAQSRDDIGSDYSFNNNAEEEGSQSTEYTPTPRGSPQRKSPSPANGSAAGSGKGKKRAREDDEHDSTDAKRIKREEASDDDDDDSDATIKASSFRRAPSSRSSRVPPGVAGSSAVTLDTDPSVDEHTSKPTGRGRYRRKNVDDSPSPVRRLVKEEEAEVKQERQSPFEIRAVSPPHPPPATTAGAHAAPAPPTTPCYLELRLVRGKGILEKVILPNSPEYKPTPAETADALKRATHVRLLPKARPSADLPPYALSARAFDELLALTPHLSWLVLEDVRVKNSPRGAPAAPRTLHVLSISVTGAMTSQGATLLRELLAPFSSVEHVHLDFSVGMGYVFHIPRHVKIRGWHVNVSRGRRVIQELAQYAKPRWHKIHTLNFVGTPDDDDDDSDALKEDVREILSVTMRDIRFLGISPVFLTQRSRETELDEVFVSMIVLSNTGSLALHLPFRERRAGPPPPSGALREEYPSHFQEIHRPWISALSLLSFLYTNTRAPLLRNIAVIHHGSVPGEHGVSPTWWAAARDQRLDAFSTRAADILGVPARGYPPCTIADAHRSLCVDMSHLTSDGTLDVDAREDAYWLARYLFPGVQARKVWVGPRTLGAVKDASNVRALVSGDGMARHPENALRASLGMAGVEEWRRTEERVCGVVNRVDGGGELGGGWGAPGLVCPLWVARLWWPVVGSRDGE